MNRPVYLVRLVLIGSLTGVVTIQAQGQPTIGTVTPVANHSHAPRTSAVTVQFTQPLDAGSEVALHVFSNQRGGRRTGNTGATTLNGNTLSFSPAFNFKPGETVFTTVTTAARSSSGNLLTPRVQQFTTAATGGNATFSAGAEVAVGSNPYLVLSADIDGDGDLDLLTPNFTGNSVSIRLNNGSGAFSGAVEVPVGSQPRGLAAADIDGDGDLDLVTANYNANTASVRFNNGSGAFSGNVEVVVGSQPQSVMTTDLEGDGDLDLLVSNGASSTVSVRINNGSGTFSGGTTVAVGSFPFSLTTGDVDNDGDIDLITGDYQSTTVSIRLNNGNGAFGGATNLAAGSQPRGVTTADVDGDNDLDLLVANAGSNNVNLFLNNGTGGFTLHSTIAVGSFPGGVTAADIDGDNDLDVLVPNIFSNTVSVRLNNGSGGFSNGADVLLSSQPYRVAMADLDDDGDLDMLVANFASNTVSVRFNNVLTDLVVSSAQAVSGTYRHVTVTGPTTGGAGIGTLTGPLTVQGTLTVQAGGTLLTACQPLTGPGSFVLAAGGTLGICDPAGIEPTGNLGAIQLTGTRTFSPDASYVYTGTVAQVTGGALPSQVRNLTTTNPTDVTLTAALTVRQALTVGAAGNLLLNGQPLTLPSTAAGTALVVNSGTGRVLGASALVQRFLDPVLNPGLGYRHYSAPVAATTLADLSTPSFTPTLNSAYNTSPTPGRVTPFPTVYSYDQSRLTTTSNPLSAFDKGWVSPLTLSAPLTPGRGYTVNLAASETVDFTGQLSTGPLTVPLARNAGTTAADAGWALVGNPYPAPIDWTLVSPADRPNLDAAMYVFESSNQYGGSYRAYTNGLGAGNPLIGTGQGFFVRVSPGQTAGSLTFRNAHRLTTYATQVPVRRGTAETRPVVQLRLQGTTGPTDDLFVYAQAGATTGFDPSYDATKLINSNGLNLGSFASNGVLLAIDGRPEFRATTTVPLSVGVPAADTYTIRAAQAINLPAGLQAYLFDARTNQHINLSQQPAYTFSVTAQEAAQAQTSRFELRFIDFSALTDLVVSAPQNVSGAYRNLTVTGPATGGAGRATLTGSLAIMGTLTVQDGGTLRTACQSLTGSGNFVLAAGGTLGICDPDGIEPTGNLGAVQLTGTRSFSPDASYTYDGPADQVTGGALPSQVRNLTIINPTIVTLTAPTTVVQALTVGAGYLELNGQPLTLASSAAGTALVVNSGTGQVLGHTAVVQRYLDPTTNSGLGYRHYSSPMDSTTVGDLTTSSFAPTINSAYNTSATPGQVTPFPTVYGYDQGRLATTTNSFSAFDKGWVSPLSLSEKLAVGRGYTVNIAASEKVDFTGQLSTGPLTVPLARNAGATAADAGWALVGNPYPAPIDWTLVSPADRPNLDAAMYVFESSNQYGGTYRAYTNGLGAGNPLIGTGQGFFVRVSPGQTAGSLTFRDAHRLTTYATQVPVRRGTADTRPVVQLRLQGTTGLTDDLFVYAQAGATAGFDPGFDAAKLTNSNGLNLAAFANNGELAIDGRPAFTTTTTVPLRVGVPAAGSYSLRAEQLFHLPTGLDAFLTDAHTGQVINLRLQPAYSFTVTAQEAAQAQTGRFALRFGPAAGPLAAATPVPAEVVLYPNPAHARFTVRISQVTGTATVPATLLNSLGQQVRADLSLSTTGTPTTLDVANLAKGVYTLRVQIGTTPIVKRVVIE